MPGISAGTIKAETPSAPGLSGSVRAKTVNRPARTALVMKRLVPLITKSPPSRRAEVRIPAASEPLSGSVNANEVITSPLATPGNQRLFCSGVPSITIPCEPMPTLVPMSERKVSEA